MKNWEFIFYENDIMAEVKDKFEKAYCSGKPVNEITNNLLEKQRSRIGNLEDEALFWFALADTQWNYGVLLPDVKAKALYWIEKNNGVFSCEFMDVSTQTPVKVNLSGLKEKLLSPQPPVQKPAQSRYYKCPWNIGDVFALRLESDLAKERGLIGRYILIQKVDETIWHPQHTVPIVYTKITADDKLPSSVEEYNGLEFIQTSFTKYEERFFPIDMARRQEDVAEKSKIHYEVDEYGYLPEYRVILVSESKRDIPKNLVYLGNYQSAMPPAKEFIPHVKHNIAAEFWEHFGKTFETKIIKRYCNHNLRELKIYAK